jgi:hypothetical protein
MKKSVWNAQNQNTGKQLGESTVKNNGSNYTSIVTGGEEKRGRG